MAFRPVDHPGLIIDDLFSFIGGGFWNGSRLGVMECLEHGGRIIEAPPRRLPDPTHKDRGHINLPAPKMGDPIEVPCERCHHTLMVPYQDFLTAVDTGVCDTWVCHRHHGPRKPETRGRPRGRTVTEPKPKPSVPCPGTHTPVRLSETLVKPGRPAACIECGRWVRTVITGKGRALVKHMV